jgi:hypothetical protein
MNPIRPIISIFPQFDPTTFRLALCPPLLIIRIRPRAKPQARILVLPHKAHTLIRQPEIQAMEIRILAGHCLVANILSSGARAVLRASGVYLHAIRAIVQTGIETDDPVDVIDISLGIELLRQTLLALICLAVGEVDLDFFLDGVMQEADFAYPLACVSER